MCIEWVSERLRATIPELGGESLPSRPAAGRRGYANASLLLTPRSSRFRHRSVHRTVHKLVDKSVGTLPRTAVALAVCHIAAAG